MRLSEALEMVARTDPGRIRAHNEDAVFADAGMGLAILADGMGGYSAGEVASQMAVTLMAEGLAGLAASSVVPDERSAALNFVAERLLDEMAATNAAVLHAAQTQPHCAGMGTTLVAACFYDNHMCVAHLGDSRLYRMRGEHFEQITRDHSLLQEQLDSGMISAEEARCSQNRNLLTRALGVDPDVETEMRICDVAAGDVILLCSDGLNDMLGDEEIALTLQMLGPNLSLAAEQLIQMANDRGGRDNISVILVRVRGSYAVPRGWWQKLLARFK